MAEKDVEDIQNQKEKERLNDQELDAASGGNPEETDVSTNISYTFALFANSGSGDEERKNTSGSNGNGIRLKDYIFSKS